MLVSSPATALESQVVATQKEKIRATVLSEGLYHPWGMTFISDDQLLITERSGDMQRVELKSGKKFPIEGLPDIEEYGQGGLLDVLADPGFKTNKIIYFSYSGKGKGGLGTEVARATLVNDELKNLKVLFRLAPKTGTGYHFGSRLVLDGDYLYITTGDRGRKKRSQKLNDHAGSVIRIHKDGRIPGDNPFLKTPNAKPEIYSYGHRNIQGAALHPETGKLWTHEHGPQGGDEINITGAGKNYGWPVITYGVNYGIGTKIGEGTHKPGMEQPIHYWVPSIAPSGMAFYTGNRFKQWKNNLLTGSLKFSLLVRMELEGNKITHEERLLKGKLGRIRDIEIGPNGLIYLLTDEDNGKLVKLEPAP